MTDLITITIQSGVLILAILLIRKLFMGKINPILQYSLWILVALRLFIPVNIESTFSLLNAAKPYTQALTAPIVQNANNTPQIIQNTPGNIINNTMNDPTSQVEAAQTAVAAPAIDLMQILMFIWIAGMAAMFIYTLMINVRFYLFVKKNGRKENGIYICKNITSPCLMGVIKPVIVLNTKAANNIISKKYAILHEETHLKHKDNIWAFARTAACIVYWFNPLVWIAANICRKDQEIACDYSVIKQIGEHNKTEYGEVLISLIRKNKTLPSLTTGMANNKKDIKERLKLIARTPKMLKITAICLALLMIAVCAVACTNTIAQDPEDSVNNTNEPAAVHTSIPAVSPETTPEISPTPTTPPYTITIDTVSEPNLTYFVADVVLSDISYLKTAFAEDKFDSGKEIVSKIAQRNNAIFAVNGDYYGWNNEGVVIRNYTAYRDNPAPKTDICAIFGDGTMKVYSPNEIDADELVAQNCYQSWSFGPILVKDGIAQTSFNSSVTVENPRTGIGYIGPNHFVFIVVDGRQGEYSSGLKMADFAKLFEELGCITAYNLDGGGTSTLYYNGSVMNKPCYGSERSISDIIYISALEDE